MEVECSIHSWATTTYHLKRDLQLLQMLIETDNSSCSKLLLQQLSIHSLTSTPSNQTLVTLLSNGKVIDQIVGFSLDDIEHLEKMIFQVKRF